MKINCDAAFKVDISRDLVKNAGLGVIIRYELGNFVVGATKTVHVMSHLEDEVLAVKEGLVLAEEVHLSKIVVETDSKIVYNELRSINVLEIGGFIQ